MNKYLERRNINLQNEANENMQNSLLQTSDYVSPHKIVLSNKTEMRKSRSRTRDFEDPNDVDESLEEVIPRMADIDSASRQTYKKDPASMIIQKPFQQHNANKDAEIKYLRETQTPFNEKDQRSNDLSSKTKFSNNEIENYNTAYNSKRKGQNNGVFELAKQNLNSYKSQNNLVRNKMKKSPSREYLKIKKKIEKDMMSPTEKLFKNQSKNNGKRSIKTTNRVSPSGGVRHLRSVSPKFNPTANNGSNPMDLYRKKKTEENKRHRKLSSEQYNSSTEKHNQSRIKEFSNEKIKKNHPRASVNRNKYEPLNNLKPATDSKIHYDKDPEDSLNKLNIKARYKSPKINITSRKRLPYEEALALTENTGNKIKKYHSPNTLSRGTKNMSNVRPRQTNDRIGHSPTSDSVFERLYQEKDSKRIKKEALIEEYEINKATAQKRSERDSNSRSGKKTRNVSKSPDDQFYKKQMELQIGAERKLITKMQEKSKKFENEIKTSRQTSRSTKRHELTANDSSHLKVHDRLFHDVKERSRKRLGIEHDGNNRNYESVGNLSVSSLARSEYRKGATKNKVSESLHIPMISKNSKRLATPKRDKNTSVNSVLYKDAEVRREKHKEEKKRSKSREKESLEKTRKGTLNTSKKMLIKRYLLEFDEISHKLGIGEDPESQIHYTQYLMLMQQLGFVGENTEIDDDKLKMIWGVIQDQNDDQDSGLYCRKHSLKVLCAAICGFSSKWMFKEYTKGQNVQAKAPKRSIIDLYGNETVPVKLDIG